jgi:N utilization substance protein A
VSLAIGKRGQNVRLAARLTGWDIDILTPPEFQNGTTRLDQTLKTIEGITQEMVDKVIALGLIDVRDIEEVGTGPLMEELGLDEETATKVVDRCAEEAKIVAVEQEAKKKAEAAEKARLAAAFGSAGATADRSASASADAGSRGIDGVAFANPLLPQGGSTATEGAPAADDGAGETPSSMPGAMEATEGIAPEIGTHSEETIAGGDELSVEEKAIQAPGGDQPLASDGEADRKDYADEDTDTAALAEGRAEPPTGTRSEP